MKLAFAIKIRDVTSQDDSLIRPLTYHERTGHIQSRNVMLPAQIELDKVAIYCNTYEMMINASKTVTMLFNTSKKIDFLPRLKIGNDNYLEVVSRYKLLGVIIQNDLKWNANTSNICHKGFARLWMLRRLKSLGASMEELVDVYIKQVRSVLELAVPVWEPGLTKSEKGQLERVQKYVT